MIEIIIIILFNDVILPKVCESITATELPECRRQIVLCAGVSADQQGGELLLMLLILGVRKTEQE